MAYPLRQRIGDLPVIVASWGDNSKNNYMTSYLEENPYLVNLYEGYGFAIDYVSAQGHKYCLEDVAATYCPHPKANCLTCKSLISPSWSMIWASARTPCRSMKS